jgi:hypothetical protein
MAEGELEKNARHYGRGRTCEKCAPLWQRENLRKMRGIMGDEKCAELCADGELVKNARHFVR